MGNAESETSVEAWMAAAALGLLRLRNGGAKDAVAAAVGGRTRRLEQLGCGGLRPSSEVAAPVGMAGLEEWGNWGLGFGWVFGWGCGYR